MLENALHLRRQKGERAERVSAFKPHPFRLLPIRAEGNTCCRSRLQLWTASPRRPHRVAHSALGRIAFADLSSLRSSPSRAEQNWREFD